jgi:hypothetical protein
MKNRLTTFKGDRGNDVYQITKGAFSAQVFTGSKWFSVDNEELIQSQVDSTIWVTDEDGGEWNIQVSDIELIEIYS